MIVVTVMTQMCFKNKESFEKFVNTDEAAKTTGFAKEILQAKTFGHPINVDTYRPSFGALTMSTVAYDDYSAMNVDMERL